MQHTANQYPQTARNKFAPPSTPEATKELNETVCWQAPNTVLIYHGNPETGEYTVADVLAPGQGVVASIRVNAVTEGK